MQHEFHRCPVTALAFLREDLLLAGEGNYLKIYGLSSGDALESIKIFEDQAVHGIIVADNGSLALVWGGRYVRLVTISGDGTDLSPCLEQLQVLDDWVLDAAFANHVKDEGTTAALVTAHNALWTLHTNSHLSDTNDQGPAQVEAKSVVSGSNCILYSAHVKWLSASRCLVASGTAFGDIILWSTFFDKDGARSETHFTVSAHEGSVFGVQISSPVELPGTDQPKRLLASCSDDRTIRLWDITNLDSRNPDLTPLQRDTGFGSTSKADSHAPPLLAKVMGHTSRIWHVRFSQDATVSGESITRILSCGEDAYLNIWSLEPSFTGLPYALKQVTTRSSHAGKNIWSVAQHDSGAAATGGADGAIAYHIGLSDPGTVVEIERDRLQLICGSDKDNYKAYAFTSKDALVSTTEQGRVILIQLHGAEPHILELSPPLAGLRGYSIVTSGVGGCAFISGTDGSIYAYYQVDTQTPNLKLHPFGHRGCKTAGLFAAKSVDGRLTLLVTSVGGQSGTMYIWPHSKKDWINCDMKERRLELPPGYVVTSYAIWERPGLVYAILGTRTGSLIICAYVADFVAPTVIYASLVRDDVHGKEAVTALLVKTRGEDRQPYILSTGRDGTLAVHHLDFTNPHLPSLKLVHQLSLPFGPNIEGLCISPVLSSQLVWGFNSKHFVVYDTLIQQETLSIECGGAHRNWAFHPAGEFVWTKASKVHRYSQPERPSKLINSGGHGREIKAVAVSQDFINEGEILATGAEDTNIKLFSLQHSGRQGFKCLHTLRKHNTGIQHLAWNGEYLFSSGGFEEFFVWRVSRNVPCFAVGVVCESQHPRSGKSDLRVCGFDVKRVDEGFEVWMAYSDSSLKLWRYCCGGEWEMLAAGDYLTSCLTHVLRPFDGGKTVVTAATDGHLALWRADGSSVAWYKRHKVHQSAIHALTSLRLPDGSVLLATGGDDNAIALSRLSPYDSIQTLLLPRAHAAAVAGLVVLPSNSKEGRFWLVSTSIDQRVKLWQLEIDESKAGIEGIEVKRVHNVFTSVADTSDIEVCTLEDGAKGLLLCGVGVDVWRLPEDAVARQQVV